MTTAKRPDQDEAPAFALEDALEAAQTRFRVSAAQREAETVAWLRAQVEQPAGERGRAAQPVYAALERQHGPWLRKKYKRLSDSVFDGSKWLMDVEEARRQGGELLKLLTDSPRTIARLLDEVQAITPQFAGTGRIPQLSRDLIDATHGAARFPDLLATFDALLTTLEPRLLAEEPSPAPAVSAPVVTEPRAHRSRFARSTLRHGDDDE